MKKIIAMLLVTCLCLSLAACGGSPAPAATEPDQKAPETANDAPTLHRASP